MAQDAIQLWYVMNSVVNCKMAGDLLSNSHIIKMDSAAWGCCCCCCCCGALPGRLSCPVRNSASPYEGYGEGGVWRYRSKDFFPRH